MDAPGRPTWQEDTGTAPGESTAAPALTSAEARREMIAAGHRRRIVSAAGVDPEGLSEQGRRILGWLTRGDDWTVGGLVEILAATRTAAQVAVHQEAIDRKVKVLRDSEAAVEAALARYDERAEQR